jgi:hypothetical protein
MVRYFGFIEKIEGNIGYISTAYGGEIAEVPFIIPEGEHFSVGQRVVAFGMQTYFTNVRPDSSPLYGENRIPAHLAAGVGLNNEKK